MFDFLGIDKILGMKTEPDYEPDRNISKINQNPEAERNQVSNPSMISGMSPRFLDLPRGIIRRHFKNLQSSMLYKFTFSKD